MERVFSEMLVAHRKIEEWFGIAPNDVGGAVAVSVADSYMAYRNSPFPDENFHPLVQNAGDFAPQPCVLACFRSDDTYDQIAILGMFMAAIQMGLQRQPDHAVESGMRERGKEYLERFLRTDTDRVQIYARGLVLK